MNIEEVLLEGNVMRENEEGIGLSDALLRIVEFAYYAGHNQNSAVMSEAVRHAEIHHQSKVRELVGKQTRELEAMSLVLKSAVVALHKGKADVVDALLEQVIYDINKKL